MKFSNCNIVHIILIFANNIYMIVTFLLQVSKLYLSIPNLGFCSVKEHTAPFCYVIIQSKFSFGFIICLIIWYGWLKIRCYLHQVIVCRALVSAQQQIILWRHLGINRLLSFHIFQVIHEIFKSLCYTFEYLQTFLYSKALIGNRSDAGRSLLRAADLCPPYHMINRY